MKWIKQNPAQFALAVVALGLIAATLLLYRNYAAFGPTFASRAGSSSLEMSVPVLELAPLDHALGASAQPYSWKPMGGTLAFAGKPRVLIGARLERLEGKMFHPPVLNDWLKKYGLDPADPNVLSQDPDKDGFSTLLEWCGLDALSHLDARANPVLNAGNPLPDDSTNPIVAESHPPYHTRLVLEQVVDIPFRLKFMAYDINPRNPKQITVQINMLDVAGKTHFKELGEDIPNSSFKTVSFEKKEAPGPGGVVNDVSELTVLNQKTGEKVVLPLGEVVNSPESHVVLRYSWVAPGGSTSSDGKPSAEMHKRKGEEFWLPPENDQRYKVIGIRPNEADLQLPSGEKYTIRKAK